MEDKTRLFCAASANSTRINRGSHTDVDLDRNILQHSEHTCPFYSQVWERSWLRYTRERCCRRDSWICGRGTEQNDLYVRTLSGLCGLVTNPCPTHYDPMDCSPPGSSVHGILQARILEWAAISFSRGFPDLGIEPMCPALAGGFFTMEPSGKPFSGFYIITLISILTSGRQHTPGVAEDRGAGPAVFAGWQSWPRLSDWITTDASYRRTLQPADDRGLQICR